MPNWLQRIAKGQMELNNETPNSAVIDAVMSDDKNKDEAVKAAIQRDAEIDKRNAGILAAAMSSMFPVLDFSKYGFLKGLAKVGIETATGAAGGYLGNRGGKYLDDKLGTSFLQGIGSFAGGLAGYGLGNRAYTAYSLTRPLKLRTDYIKQNIVSNQNTINPRYFDSNGFNAENIATDYASGRQSAINFLGSEIKRNSDKHNAELAKRIGYKHFDPNVTAEVRAATPMQERTNSDAIWIGDKNDGFYLSIKPLQDNAKAEVILRGNPIEDELVITPFTNIDRTTFHEFLHRGNYGAYQDKPLSDPWNLFRNNNTDSFYNWKTRHLLKDATPIGDYLYNPGEAAANFLETGNKEMGLSFGQPYPGKKPALDFYKNFLSGNSPKTFVLEKSKWETKPKRVWDALTGKYYLLPLVGGFTLNSNQNDNSN